MFEVWCAWCLVRHFGGHFLKRSRTLVYQGPATTKEEKISSHKHSQNCSRYISPKQHTHNCVLCTTDNGPASSLKTLYKSCICLTFRRSRGQKYPSCKWQQHGQSSCKKEKAWRGECYHHIITANPTQATRAQHTHSIGAERKAKAQTRR